MPANPASAPSFKVNTDYPLDILEVSFSNLSTVSAQVTLKDDGTSVRTLQIPAGVTLELAGNTVIPQSVKGSRWYLDMEDITGTTVVVDAILIKNR